MDRKTSLDAPPWDWPEGAGKMFREVPRDERADESDRLVAAELAGDLIVINDELVDALLSVVRRGDQPEQMRARAECRHNWVLGVANRIQVRRGGVCLFCKFRFHICPIVLPYFADENSRRECLDELVLGHAVV